VLNKGNLILGELVAKDSSYYGKHILVSDNYTAATDGHVLAFVNRPKGETEDFPVSPDGSPAKPKQGKFLLSLDDAKKLEKAIPSKSRFPICLNSMPLEPSNGYRKILAGEPGSMTPYVFTPPEEKFPNFKCVWPTGKPVFQISFGVKILKRLLTVIERASEDRTPMISFDFHGDDKAAKFTARLTWEGQKMTGLIMPMKR